MHKETLELAQELKDRGVVFYNERVTIVRDKKEEEVRPSGIIIPEGTQLKPIRGTIVGLGLGMYEGTELLPRYRGIHIGMRIAFIKYNAAEHEYVRRDGTKVLLETIHASDVYFGWPAKGDE